MSNEPVCCVGKKSFNPVISSVLFEVGLGSRPGEGSTTVRIRWPAGRRPRRRSSEARCRRRRCRRQWRTVLHHRTHSSSLLLPSGHPQRPRLPLAATRPSGRPVYSLRMQFEGNSGAEKGPFFPFLPSCQKRKTKASKEKKMENERERDREKKKKTQPLARRVVARRRQGRCCRRGTPLALFLRGCNLFSRITRRQSTFSWTPIDGRQSRGVAMKGRNRDANRPIEKKRKKA